MKQKNAFWFSLVFAVCLACVPVGAQAAKQTAAPPPPPQAQRPAPPHLTPDQQDAQRTISGPYRLTYTVTEMDGSRRVGSQRYEFVQDANSMPVHMYIDSFVPVHYGSASSPLYDKEHIGMKILARLYRFSNGIELSTDITQTGIAQATDSGQVEQSGPPVTRALSFSTAVLIKENEPITIGRLDMPGSTHTLQIEVKISKLP